MGYRLHGRLSMLLGILHMCLIVQNILRYFEKVLPLISCFSWPLLPASDYVLGGHVWFELVELSCKTAAFL